MLITILLLSLLFLIPLIYLWVTMKHVYWRRRNIPGPTPCFIGGNIKNSLIGKKNMGDIFADIYRDYKNYSFVGIYEIFTPAVLVTNLEIVKTVLTKDFDSFADNTVPFNMNTTLFESNPFVLNGQKWKTIRPIIAQLLSNSKVKSTVPVFNESANQMVAYIKKEAKAGGNASLEARDLTTSFTASIVASWGLGLDAKCFESENDEFQKLSKTLFRYTFKQNISFLLAMIFPPLAPFLDISIMPQKAEDRVVAIIKESIRYREENQIDKNDYLGDLLDLKKSGSIAPSEVIGHIGTLYAGLESTSLAFHLILYEVAADPGCQEKLRKEIDETLGQNNETTFEVFQDMKYLDAVLNEALRIHFFFNVVDRQTTKRYNLSGSTGDGKQLEVTLEPGTSVIIPVRGMHMDEKVFSDPKTFKPERFLYENKENIPKYMFMPFGEGPRMCPGMNFAKYQMKVGLVYLVQNFKMSLDGTPYPPVIDPSGVLSIPKEPIRIKFQKRA